MTWGAHKADVRIAAKNSVTMRAALRASIKAQTIYEAYQETHPFVTDNNTQDRARARAWAMMHVKIDPEPIEAALIKIYTDGFLLGLDASKEAIGRAEKTNSKSAITKADDSDYVDWANWKPGNRAASLLYRPTGAFKTILDHAGIVSKTIAKAGYDRIGTALSDSIAAGFSPARAAKVITEDWRPGASADNRNYGAKPSNEPSGHAELPTIRRRKGGVERGKPLRHLCA